LPSQTRILAAQAGVILKEITNRGGPDSAIIGIAYSVMSDRSPIPVYEGDNKALAQQAFQSAVAAGTG
jgi:hypothetical protein